MENQKQTRIYFPILFLLSWLLFTILVFVFGPWKYELINPFIFYSYLFLIHLALFLGYLRGLNNNAISTRITIDYNRFVELTIIISFVYLIAKLLLTKGGDLANLINTFKNASETYVKSSLRFVNLFSYTDIFFKPISVVAITNAIYCNRKLRWGYRYCIYFIILITIATSIGSATRSGIVQLVIICFAAFLLSIYQKNFVVRYFRIALISVLIICASIGFFMYSNMLVNKREGITVANRLTGNPPKENYFLYKVTPHNSHPFINGTSFYLSHSYYQLNKALYMPYRGLGFGLTNSYFIMRNIEKVTGWSGLKDISYGIRLDNEIGGGYGIFWSTFYTWIASDFTFPGTILVVFIMGFLLSLALRDTLFSPNPFSVTSFCTLFYFIFHFVFNNPLQDGAGLTTCFVIPLLWLILRKHNNSEGIQGIGRRYLYKVKNFLHLHN
jgi:hypothetical protein